MPRAALLFSTVVGSAALVGCVLAATAVFIASTAVFIVDGSAIGAGVHTNTGAATGPMHVMRCIWTGGPCVMPYLAGSHRAWHGL